MIYAQIILEKDLTGKIKFFCSKKDGDDKYASLAVHLSEVGKDVLLDWLAENNFIPVSETFFYKA
jgi:hypothetical protein